MHDTLELLYSSDCGHDHAALGVGDNITSLIAEIKAAFSGAMEYIHGQKKYRPDMLKEPAIKAVITSTNKALQSVISKSITHEMPAEMRKALQENVFYFSGMKTHAQMAEASNKLLDENGNLKPLQKFTDDVTQINEAYNDNYLRAERNFASRSAQTAAKWQKYEQDKERYNLRYLTNNGPNVRDSHRALEFTTLPVDDPFWNEYTPPNGYNCHCFLVQVHKDEYPVSNSEEAIAKGNEATTQVGKDGTNKAAIFRFNPGKEMKVMPPDHPYTSGNCDKLQAIWQTLSAMQKAELAGHADKCRAKKVVEEMADSAARKQKDKEIAEWIKEAIPLNAKPQPADNFATGRIYVSRKAAKSVAQHFSDPAEKEMVKEIHKIIEKAELIEQKTLSPKSSNYGKKVKRGVTGYGYYKFKWKKKDWRLNTEIIHGQFEKPYAINLLKKEE